MYADDDCVEQRPGKPSIVGVFMPSAIYMTGEDKIRVTAFSNTTSVTLDIVGRILRANSTPAPIKETLAVNSNRTATTKVVQCSEGWLLGIGIAPSAGVSVLGATYVMVDVIRGDGTAAQYVQSLGSGFVTARTNYAWPGGNNLLSTDGPGQLRSVTGATPGAGNEISETVPSGARYQLLAFHATFTTSATVINRVPSLVIDDGTTRLIGAAMQANQVASTAYDENYWPGGGANTLNTPFAVATLPSPLFLGAGYRIKSLTNNIQAGDAYTAVQYLVKDWNEGA